MQTFFEQRDHVDYIDLLATACRTYKVEIWSYCLMPNHVHLIAVPETAEGMSLAMGQAHCDYARLINERQGWSGRLWQGRFWSTVMDPEHTWQAALYIEQNPVRAGMVERPEDHPWSSARAHLTGQNDALVRAKPLLDQVGDWRAFLDTALPSSALDAIRKSTRTGRALAATDFSKAIEATTGIRLLPRPRGRPRTR